jgi:hypothetical protein
VRAGTLFYKLPRAGVIATWILAGTDKHDNQDKRDYHCADYLDYHE